MEVWKDITNYNGYYQVSNHGRVRSITRTVLNNGVLSKRKGKMLSPRKERYGYTSVRLYRNSASKSRTIHRLVLEAFGKKQPSPLHECNHKNGIQNDNHINNLEWLTHAENIQHSFDELDRHPARGEASGNVKLTANDVRKIRRLYATNKYTFTKIGKQFGVYRTTISRIINNKTWTHI